MPEIKLEHITKRWGKFYAVEDLDLTIAGNAFVTLLGPSGCGKTTTLRMIAGLETPTSGRITIGDKDEVFRYHITKVEEEDGSLKDLPKITNEDFVLGIRSEFLEIAEGRCLTGEIYGAMPTGMESTIKVRVGEFLLTGVVFGSSLFTIGSQVPLAVKGDRILLFDRKSGKCVTSGSLTFVE